MADILHGVVAGDEVITSTADPTSSRPHWLRVDGRPSGKPASGSRWVPTAADRRPRLSWTVPLRRECQGQTGYQLQVESAPRAGRTTTILDTGVVEGRDPWHHLVRPLDALSSYRWRVRVRDEEQCWTPWSGYAPLECGPWCYTDWQADWITVPPLRQMRIPITLEQPVERARLHLTAQGLVRASFDGVAINGHAVDPSRTDIARALYRTYDVTDLCTPGEHVLDLTLARGAWAITDLPPRVLATCVVELPDGTIRHFGTRAAMATAPSAVVVEQPFYLERHDLRVSDPFVHAGEATAITPVSCPSSPASPPLDVAPDPGPPVHATSTVVPNLLGDEGGRRVYDVGLNIAGRVRLRILDACPAGTEIRLVHGEHLGADGAVDTVNLTLPHDRGRTRQVLEFVLAGVGDEVCEAWFSYAGFRYVEITGLPPATRIELTADTLHSDLAPTGTVETDSAVVERLVDYGRRTLLNNVHGIPEDCPTREQAGWTGDTASATEFELSAFDAEGFFTKWLGDLRTSQLDDGAIPAIAPNLSPKATPPDPVWGAALQRVLLGHWLQYGDRRVLDANLPALRRWTDWLLGCIGPDGIVDGAPISYGHDWLGLQQTPPELHQTGAAIDALDVLAKLEAEVGSPDAARRAQDRAEALRTAARAAFVDPDRRVVGNGSQGSLAVALEAGLLTDDERAWAVADLVAAIRGRGNRVSSGFATTRTVVRALAHARQDQVVFDVLTQPAEPGVGAMIASDMGTFWECWWIDPANTGTGSLDHVGLGGPFAGWVWQFLAGVQPLSAGFGRFLVDPHPVSGVKRLSARIATVRGDIDLAWQRDGEALEVELTVPVSATAVLPTPDGPVELSAGVHRLRVPRPVTTSRPALTQPAWSPPAWASQAAYVDTAPLLDTTTAHQMTSTDGARIEVLPDGLRCMPVPHEQEPGPVVRITGAAGTSRAMASLELDADLESATFAYARVDTCLPTTRRPVRAVLRLHAADGSVRCGTARLWPAGWSRVAVDIQDWPGRSRIVRIEVGVEVNEDTDPIDDHPAAVHVGTFGVSTARRTW
ncbi:family 78 glycoside hydrolase catalytic domain [Pseudactinotalea terrae]|uniref:family 78 glycoside hydrolase catalytic domain n=1 Tax=Pseudactinotalea terrae TaxID=1743262 RepID=UPI0012E275DB|nr:family 78 glycoside hydrolase catalytic domain [Pseudactinotalea terrae]